MKYTHPVIVIDPNNGKILRVSWQPRDDKRSWREWLDHIRKHAGWNRVVIGIETRLDMLEEFNRKTRSASGMYHKLMNYHANLWHERKARKEAA